MVRLRLLGGVVPAEVVVAVREVDVLLVEDGRPLEGRAVQALAGRAVAVLGGQGAVAAELVLDAPAVALTTPLYDELLLLLLLLSFLVLFFVSAVLLFRGRGGVMDSVWRSVLPLVFFAMCGGACLVLVWLFAMAVVTIAIRAVVVIAVFVLFFGTGRHAGLWHEAMGRLVEVVVDDDGHEGVPCGQVDGDG